MKTSLSKKTVILVIFVTARKRSLRRQCFHRCLSIHRGVSVPLHAGIHPPGADPPSRYPPDQGQTSPRSRHPPDQRRTPTLTGSRHHTPQTRGRHPLGADTPPPCSACWEVQATRVRYGTHPTGMHTCFWVVHQMTTDKYEKLCRKPYKMETALRKVDIHVLFQTVKSMKP